MKILSYNIYGVKDTEYPIPKWEIRQENIQRILNDLLLDSEIKVCYFKEVNKNNINLLNETLETKIKEKFMKLTSKEALKMLEEERHKTSNERWINHSICVGNVAGRIAKALNLDEDFSKTLGYIHDIGKRYDYIESGVFPHAMKGYDYIKFLGYDEEYAGICIKHSFLNNDIDCISNDRDETDRTNPNFEFVKNYIKDEYTIYEKIINLCDLMCTTKVLTIDKRGMDLLLRHGVYAKTHYHIKETYKLKAYFDDLLGYNLYDLFPEIKDNL